MNINPEKRRKYYASQAGTNQGTLPDLENQFLQAKTSSIGTTPDLWGKFLRSLGYTGLVDEMKDKWRRLTGGEAATFDPAATSLFSRMSVQPDSTRKTLINNTIVQLKAKGIWDRADFIHFHAAHDSQAGLLCWNNPAYNAAIVNGATFVTDRGVVGNGVDGHLTTGAVWNALTNFKQDEAAIAVWETLSVTEDTYSMGAGSNNLRLSGRLLSGQSAFRLNSASVSGQTAADSKGLTAVSRVDSANVTRYKNGVGVSSTQASAVLAANAIYYLRSTAVYSNRRVGFGYLGASLSAQQHADLYTIVNDYMTAIGAL